MLEKFVTDKVNSIRNCIGNNLILSDDDDFSKLFFAMAAPSMTGKTQAAFAFKTLRCLYFLLTESSSDNLQEIYKSFSRISKEFQILVADDFEKLNQINALDEESGDIFNQISPTLLLQNHRNYFALLQFSR